MKNSVQISKTVVFALILPVVILAAVVFAQSIHSRVSLPLSRTTTSLQPAVTKSSAAVAVDGDDIDLAEEAANETPAEAGVIKAGHGSEEDKKESELLKAMANSDEHSHGSEITAVEAMIPIGKWGMVTLGTAANPQMYKMGYAELTFLADGTYTCHGWVWGKEYAKTGVWRKEGEHTVIMEDKAMTLGHEAKSLVWVKITYAQLSEQDGHQVLAPEAGGLRSYMFGVHYDIASHSYYDDLRDERLALAH